MNYGTLISKVGKSPCFETGFLAAGESLSRIRLQLSRWCKAGKVLQIRRGLYVLAEPYRKCEAEPFYIANAIKPSYVSLHSALAWWGLIPEYVPETTSVTTGRPGEYETPLGRFSYRHVSVSRFWASQLVKSVEGIEMRIASPEKALLDLIYLTPGGEKLGFLRELRLQNMEVVNLERLTCFAERMGGTKMRLACDNLERLMADSAEEVTL